MTTRWFAGRRHVPLGLLGACTLSFALAACRSGEEATGAIVDRPGNAEARAQEDLVLYFPGRDGRLHAELRSVPQETDLRRKVTAAAQALVDGPTKEGLSRPFAEGTALGEVDLVDGSVAYVWLQPPPGTRPSMGSREELLTVYSLVETLAANVPGLLGVVPLQSGQQMATWAGHVDTTRPLRPGRFRLINRTKPGSQGGVVEPESGEEQEPATDPLAQPVDEAAGETKEPAAASEDPNSDPEGRAPGD